MIKLEDKFEMKIKKFQQNFDFMSRGFDGIFYQAYIIAQNAKLSVMEENIINVSKINSIVISITMNERIKVNNYKIYAKI